MNTNKIKVFSNDARNELDTIINNKFSVDLKESQSINYNWFIRLTILTFLNKNNYIFKSNIYQPNKFTLEHSILASCNRLKDIFPELFKDISEKEKLILPLILKSKFFKNLNNNSYISEDEWKNIEIIGWIYQEYISKENSYIIKNNKIYNKSEIPLATQVFTPKWIVKYMVDNTLGRFWLEYNKNSLLKQKFKYLILNENQEQRFINKSLDIKNITFFDPAMGTGNILLYAFDVFYEIYLEIGYKKGDISRQILENNIFGLEIDDNVGNIAKFSLLIKAEERESGFLNNLNNLNSLKLNINSIIETNKYTSNIKEYITTNINKKYYKFVNPFFNQYLNAKIYGSLTKTMKFPLNFLNHLYQITKNTTYEKQTLDLINQTKILNNQYCITVTNPPYIGRRNLSKTFKDFLNLYYPIGKSDVFSAFIIYCTEKTYPNGHIGLMTPYVWMFISSYENLRKYIIEKKEISSLIQLEYSGFSGATVPICTFTLKNNNFNIPGEYIKLSEFAGIKEQKSRTEFAIKNKDTSYRYTSNSNNFKNIIGYPIAFWVSQPYYNLNNNSIPLKELAYPRQGIATGNNDNYLKLWHEVDFNDIGFGFNNIEDFHKSNKIYAPYNKGGKYRKWYGNFEYVIKFDEKNYNKLLINGNKLPSKQFYFKEGITWSFISSSYFSVRYTPIGSVFDVGGSSIFPKYNNLYYLIGLLCSKLSKQFMDILNPTLNHQVGNIKNIPVIYSKKFNSAIEKLVKENINISKLDWDSFETSWDFKIHPLIDPNIQGNNKTTLECSLNNWIQYTETLFNNLKKNEETLNNIFINIYGLENDVKPFLEDKDITICKIVENQNSIDKRNSYIIDTETALKSFLSYFTGCTLGRYSISKEGLNTDNYICDLYPSTKQINFKNLEYKLLQFLNILFIENYRDQNLNYLYNILNISKKYSLENYFKKDLKLYHEKIYQKKNIYNYNANYINYKYNI